VLHTSTVFNALPTTCAFVLYLHPMVFFSFWHSTSAIETEGSKYGLCVNPYHNTKKPQLLGGQTPMAEQSPSSEVLIVCRHTDHSDDSRNIFVEDTPYVPSCHTLLSRLLHTKNPSYYSLIWFFPFYLYPSSNAVFQATFLLLYHIVYFRTNATIEQTSLSSVA
jgi:hypothetical protein